MPTKALNIPQGLADVASAIKEPAVVLQCLQPGFATLGLDPGSGVLSHFSRSPQVRPTCRAEKQWLHDQLQPL